MSWFKKKEVEHEVCIQYLPLKNITKYELAWMIYILKSDGECSRKRLLELIDEHKLGRHFKFDGIRGK